MKLETNATETNKRNTTNKRSPEQNRTDLYLRTNTQSLTGGVREHNTSKQTIKKRNRQSYNNKTYTDYMENVVAHLFIII